MSIQLITDSACDLPLAYVEMNQIEVVSLEVNIKGEFIKDDLGQTLAYKDFYQLLRDGELTSTSQVNIQTFEDVFRKHIEAGNAVIFIGLASVLSGTVNSARVARSQLLETYPDAVIHVIDSKSVCLGEGLLVHRACEWLKEGLDANVVAEKITNLIPNVGHDFIVDDLNFLKRGGRISGTVAAVGSLLNLKPTLRIDGEGKVTPVGKVKGTKKAIGYLVEQVKKNGQNLAGQTIFIAHADDLENAQILEKLLREQTEVKEIIINYVGTVIGTHAGPGALAVFYEGVTR